MHNIDLAPLLSAVEALPDKRWWPQRVESQLRKEVRDMDIDNMDHSRLEVPVRRSKATRMD